MHTSEVIALVVVLALVAVLVATNLPALSGPGVYTAAHQIAADIRFARHLAITDAVDYVVTFFADPLQPGRFARYVVKNSLTGERVVERRIDDAVSCSGPDELTLKPDGSAGAAGTLACTAEALTYKIALSRLTGRVAITRMP